MMKAYNPDWLDALEIKKTGWAMAEAGLDSGRPVRKD
jgi:hypothetical protein